MTRDEDDGLDWGPGIDDPTYTEGGASEPPVVATAFSGRGGTNSALLVAYGIFAGVYLLYVVGWVLSVERDTFTAATLFFEIMYQLGEFLAVVAPFLWFGLTFLLTRNRPPIARVLWLVGGIVLLAPWPFILSGSAA